MYTPDSVNATHALRYDWTGWLSQGATFPSSTPEAIRTTQDAWMGDGLNVLEYRVRNDSTQILLEAAPQVSPTLATQRIKGRLQHTLRQAGTPVTFSRKVSFRSLGENTRPIVERYLLKQVGKEGFVDPRFIARMNEYTVESPEVDLNEPATSHSGRYWYNLHLVMVTSGRCRVVDYEYLARERDGVIRVAQAKGYLLKSLSVMPDHVHLAFRGDISQSPGELALCFMNNLAFLLGRNRIWADEYYVGTFSEYSADIIRKLSDQSFVPVTQGHRGRRTDQH